MSAAYFIVLDNAEPGFDPFINGKALSRAGQSLTKVAKSLGIKELDEFVSMDADEAAAMAEDFGLDDVEIPPEQWFSADHGLTWIATLSSYLAANTKAIKNADAVLEDLRELQAVLVQAKAIGARWHLAIDF